MLDESQNTIREQKSKLENANFKRILDPEEAKVVSWQACSSTRINAYRLKKHLVQNPTKFNHPANLR